MRHTYQPYIHYCAKLRKNHLLRHLPKANTFQYDFSSNDYLGLSQHPLMRQAAIEAADKYGVGSTASRLITINQSQLKALEASIATAKHTQSALIFISGYQANLSVLSALLDPMILGTTPLVFSDKLNHASMHAACKTLNIKQQRFSHLDYDHLKYLLQKTKSLSHPRFILSESVFGMDGDVADLALLIKLAKDYSAILYIDEAHATGLFGKNGYGLTSDFGNEVDITMGTFSKALGGSGAYITCSSSVKRFLINKCQGFVFSTAPSPMQVGAMQQAWDLIPMLQPEVKKLHDNAKNLREKLQQSHFDTGSSHTHIIPIILNAPSKTLAAQRFLASKGIRVSAIRSPSVPPNQSRLRIALNVNHTDEAINYLYSALTEILENRILEAVYI